MSLDPQLQMRNKTLADSLTYSSETLSKDSSYDMLDFWPRELHNNEWLLF